MAGTRQRAKLWRVKLISLAVASCFAREAVYANPTGPAVVNGQVTFHQQGSLLSITNSPGSIINWQSFSIGANEVTRFLQQSPSSAVLNRVVTRDPSSILGALQSNGRVFLINPNGILFGAGAQIDVAGLVASSLKLSDADFLAGRMRFTEVAGAGSVINQGAINTAQGGQVYLVGPAVTNQGIITSPKGEVILAAGNRVELVDPGTPNLRVEITAPDNQVVNLGQIVAEAGRVGIHAGLINQSGTIRADSAVVTEDGRIVLKATKSVTLEAASLTSASGAKGGEVAVEAPLVIQTGDVRADGATGGSVSVQAENFLQSAALSADGTQGAGGSVSVRADRIIQTESAVLSASGNGGAGGTVNVAAGQDDGGRIFSSAMFSATGDTGGEIAVTGRDIVLRAATLDASGENAGGTILVGGDWQGGNPDVPNSRSAHVNFSTTLRADARQRGDGGKVVVWSDQDTQFFGSVSARGGAEAGDGGRIEVSGKENLVFGGHADAGAPNGHAGMLLLDPKNITIDASAGPSAIDLVDPNIGADDQFGTGAVVLTNGNIVAPDSNDSFAATKAGAVYVFDGTTGALVSALTGSSENDQVGFGGVTPLSNSNFVVSSPNWNSNRGAATWGSGTTGVTGSVSSANSLVGSTPGEFGDFVGNFGITTLANGNYVVNSPNWSNGTATNVGAVTWGNGSTGVTGVVSNTNSLVGTTTDDQVGTGGVTALANGHYVVSSYLWNRSATLTAAGAVTWASGSSGVTGAVSSANSLVGSNANDQLGMGGVYALTNGNYVVSSPNWGGERGAVTWRSGTTAATGTVDIANSLVGSTPGDMVGVGGVTALTNGNYVVSSYFWNNSVATAGAVTWGSGITGVVGTVSASNSLVGAGAGDMVGNLGVTALANGNYVVSSPNWNGDRGAATWGSGSAGVTGAVSGANSLIGTSAGDQVGSSGVTALTNGNYVVSSPSWSNGAASSAGAVTWGSGSTGVTGAVSASNSLVGTSAGDQVGWYMATALTNGNYVVSSPFWNDGAIMSAGAVTWGNGTTGVTGAVNNVNSLAGTSAGDQVGYGGVAALANGNYVVSSPNWNNGRGAVTWGSGTLGTTGTIGTANSLVGANAGDQVGGFFRLTALANGNYVVSSPDWNLGQGAATWGNGTTGVTGVVSSANSLTGTSAGDQLGSGGITELSGNRVLVGSPFFDNGAVDSGRLQIYDGSSLTNPLAFSNNPSGNVTITPLAITAITNTGTAVTLQANNDVTLNSAITSNNPVGNGGALTLQAGRSILVNANITTDNGNLTLTANETAANGVIDAHRDPGNAVIAMAPGTAIDTGTGNLSITLGTGNAASGAITLQSLSGNAISVTNSGSTQGGGIALNGPVNAGGAFTATTLNGGIALNANLSAAGAVDLFGSGSGVTLNGNIVTAGAGVTIFDNVVLGAAPTVLIDTTNGGAVPGGRTIVVQGTINDDATDTSLALRAGTSGVVSLIGDVGGTTPIEGLTVISSNVARLPNVQTREGGISVSTTGSAKLLGNLDTRGGTTGAGNVTLAGPVELVNDVQITTDRATGADGHVSFVGTGTTIDTDPNSTPRALTINAGGGDVTFGGAVGGTRPLASLTASGNLISLNGGVVNGAVVLDAGSSGTIAFSGSLLAGSLSANAGGGIADSTGTTLAIAGNTSFSGGDIVLGDAAPDVTNFGSLTFNSTGAVNITEDSSIALTGTNTASSLTLASAGAISDAAGTGLTVTSNASLTGTSITLGTAGTVNFGSLTFNSTDAVNIAEDSAMVLTGTNTAGNLALTANGGSITQAAGTVTANALELSAETGISLPALAVTSVQATNSTSGDVILSDTGGLSVTGISNTGGTISVATTGGLTVDGNVDSGANATSLTATGGSITHAAGALTAGMLALTSSGGSIGQTGGSITAGSAILNADTGISLTAGSIATLEATNNVSGDISVTGMSGSLTAGAGGIDNAAAAGNVTLGTTGALSLAGDVTVQPGQTISLSGGTIGSTGGNPVADTLLLSSVNGATLNNIVANRLSAVNTGTGNIDLSVQNDVEIFGAGLTNVGGDATLSAAGDLTLGANVNAAGAATLTAGGSIAQTGGVVLANTVVLTSTNGSIGTGTSGRVNTQADTLVATANNGGVFISELDSVNLAGGSAGAGGFDLVAGGALAVSGNVTSTGALNLASIGFSNNATISSAGDISIDAGGGTFTNNAGAVIAGSGTLDATGTTFTNSGTLRPGGAGAVGTLTVIGNAAFNGSGTIEIDAQLAPLLPRAVQHDVIVVTGNAGLGGSLNVINMGGYVPANGDVLVPVTFASGAGAFIIIPSSVFTAAYNANNLTLTVGEVIDLINRWIGLTGNWAVASNWSLGHIPTFDETVVIDVPGLQTITVSDGQLGAFMLTSEENFVITGGQLALSGDSTFNADFTLTGGSLTGAGDVVVDGDFDWTGGKLSGPGTFTTTGTSTLEPRRRDLELRRDWINLGTINWRGRNGRDLYIFGDATLLNATGGTLNLLGGWGSDIKGDGALVNEGTVNKEGDQTTSIKAEFSNSGTLNVKDGTLQLKDSDGNDGSIKITKHATLDVNGPGYANRGLISGTGTLDVKDTRFVNEGTVAPGSSGGAGIGTLKIAGNYSQSASGTLLMDAAGKKSGRYDRLEVTGKATLDGTLTVNAVNGYVPRKGDTLELITYKSRSGTFAKLDGPTGYYLRSDYDRRSAKFTLKPE